MKQLLKRDKKDFLHQKLFDIETSQAKLKHKKMFEGINNLTKKFTPQLAEIKDKFNKVLTDSEEISRRWTEYCTEMYDGPTTKMVQMDQNGEELEPLRSEVKWAINQLPLGKSAGNDAIHGEMIKASGEEGISIYHKLCTKIWKEEKWLSEWTKAVFVPIPKKGDLRTNYRTIALISHASKILIKIIMKRLQRKLDEEINQTQAGFRQNRGTRDQIFNLRMLIEKWREANINLHMCFIDYSKAFDCIGHREMIEALKKMNCHYKITNLIINLYKEQLAAVRLESGLTDWFPVKRGVRQGCILSTETIMRKVEADGELTSFNAVKMHGKEVKELRYAEDTVLFAQRPEGLRRLLQSVKTHSESSGLYLNAKKTKIMDLDKSPTTTIDVDGEQLENANNFVYLGSRIDVDGKSSPDIRRRIAIAISKLNSIAPLWKSQSTELKWRTLKACIFPVAIYGCEAWIISKTNEKKITSFEMKCFRKILRISWTERKTNASVLEQLGVKAPTTFEPNQETKTIILWPH